MKKKEKHVVIVVGPIFGRARARPARPVPPGLIIGGIQKIWAVSIPGYTHDPFSPKFLMGFCSDVPYECIPAKLDVSSFTRS